MYIAFLAAYFLKFHVSVSTWVQVTKIKMSVEVDAFPSTLFQSMDSTPIAFSETSVNTDEFKKNFEKPEDPNPSSFKLPDADSTTTLFIPYPDLNDDFSTKQTCCSRCRGFCCDFENTVMACTLPIHNDMSKCAYDCHSCWNTFIRTVFGCNNPRLFPSP